MSGPLGPNLERNSADALVDEIIDKVVKDRGDHDAQPRRRRTGVLAVVLCAIAFSLTGLNVIAATRTPDVTTPAEVLLDTRFTVYVIAEELLAYRDSTDTLPSTLANLNLDDARVF